MRLHLVAVALLAASVSAGKRKKKLASPTQAAPDAVAKPVTPTPAAPTPAAPANATARGPYCRSGLTGDYAYESCGKFCKEAKAENHCAVRLSVSALLRSAQRLSVSALPPAARSSASATRAASARRTTRPTRRASRSTPSPPRRRWAAARRRRSSAAAPGCGARCAARRREERKRRRRRTSREPSLSSAGRFRISTPTRRTLTQFIPLSFPLVGRASTLMFTTGRQQTTSSHT